MKKEVKNLNNKKVCEINEETKEIFIINKGYLTILKYDKDGSITIVNTTK